MKPLSRKIHIKLLEKTQERNGLVFVNKRDAADESTVTAIILAVGDEVSDLMVGDTILIPGYAGKWIGKDVINDLETHRIIDEQDVLAIVTPQKSRGSNNVKPAC